MQRIEVSWLGCFTHRDGVNDCITVLSGKIELSWPVLTTLATKQLVEDLFLVAHLAQFVFLTWAAHICWCTGHLIVAGLGEQGDLLRLRTLSLNLSLEFLIELQLSDLVNDRSSFSHWVI